MTLPITTEQASAIARLRAALADTRVVIIGAAALGHHVQLRRATADVDLVVATNAAALDATLPTLGWRRDGRVPHRWQDHGGTRVDLLAVTERDIEAGEVHLDEGVRMSLVGVDLALGHTTVVPLEAMGVEVEVATLPALVVLKIAAWLDRPYERDKDLEDLVAILDRALPDDDERRWEPEHPVFLSGLDHEDQSAFFIGSEVARIVEERHQLAIATFRARLEAPDGAAFAQMVRAARYGGEDGEARLARRLAAFWRGMG